MLKKPTRLTELRVGLADTNPYSRSIIISYLQECGVRAIVESGDSRDLFEQMLAKPVHLVFMALELEPFNGIEVLEFLRAGKSPVAGRSGKKTDVHIPVVLVTSDSDKSRIEFAVRKGVNAILTRPIQMDRLEKAMDRVLSELTRGFVTGLQFEKVKRPEYTRLVFFGQFVRSSQEVIRTVFDALQKDPNKNIVLDLTNVNFIDEFGFGTLLMLFGVADQMAKQLSVIAPSDTIGRELRSVGVGDVITLYDTHFDYVDNRHFHDRSALQTSRSVSQDASS